MKAYMTDDGKLMLIPEFDKDDTFLASLAQAENPQITAQITKCERPHLSHVTIALREPTSALPAARASRRIPSRQQAPQAVRFAILEQNADGARPGSGVGEWHVLKGGKVIFTMTLKEVPSDD